MPTLFRPIDAILPRAARAFGGKVENLSSLARGGFPVPRSYALSSLSAEAHFEQALPEALRPEQLFSEHHVPESRLAEARERVLDTALSPALQAGIETVLEELATTGVFAVAVRSSSLAEDQEAAAAAGLHESYLQLCGPEEVGKAIRSCWASLFQPRVLTYLRRLGGQQSYAMGILLQVTLPADVSGVMFTVNPLTGDDDEVVIDAAYGLGTVVTDGQVMPDTYRIDKDSGWVRDRVVGDKRFREDPASQGGVTRSAVPEAMASRLCLPEHQLGQLVQLGRNIERHFGGPRDVEWAITSDVLYVLQARPATGVGGRRASRPRVRRQRTAMTDPVQVVWSNINVGEALPGVATPLTWSVLSAFSEVGFRSVFKGLGCKVSKSDRLVGNFRGRIYLNLTELSRIVAQVPGLRPSVVLPLGGGTEIERLEESIPKGSHLGFFLRSPRTIGRLTLEHVRLQQRVEQFERGFEIEIARMRGLDLRILPSAALDATLSDVHRLLHETGGLMLTAYGGLLASLLPVRKLLLSVFEDGAEHRLQDFLSALSGVESAAPAAALLRVARIAADDEPARAALLGDAMPTTLEALPAGPTRNAFSKFLSEFGHRAVREAEIAEPRWREDPSLLLSTLRLHLAGHLLDQDPAERARARLTQAEEALLGVPFSRRQALRGLLVVTRHYMRLRERLRARVTQVLGLFRWVALDAARRLQVHEPECGADASFFLQLPELHAVLRGDVKTIAPLVLRRRAQYRRDQALPAPPPTFVGYPRPVEVETEDDAEGVLNGIGASGGQAQGRVCILLDLNDASAVQPGDVLVVPAADVGFSPLFLVAAAVVTEAGGPLSHACVVAREYGVPAVVSVPGVTQRLQTGQWVCVDGDEGRVVLLESPEALRENPVPA